MRNIARVFTVIILCTQIASADLPTALEGEWLVDIPQTIEKMKASGSIDANGIAYMKDKLLPKYKRTIQSGRMVNTAASGEYTAAITFRENQGANTVTNVAGEVRGKKVEFALTFIPQADGTMIMQTENVADGSGQIVWMK